MMRLKKSHMLAICIATLLNIHSFISAHTPEIDFKNSSVFEEDISIVNNTETKGNNYTFIIPRAIYFGSQTNKSIAAGYFIYDIIVAESGGSTQTSEEGTTDQFDVYLSRQPSSDVIINITGLDVSEGNLDITQLTFTSANYNSPQTVTVTGVDDPIIDGDISYTLNLDVVNALSDSHYHNQSASVNVTNMDDDEAGISVSLSDGSNQTSETGITDTIVVVLNSQPTTDVVLGITGLDISEGSLDKTELTFTDANWDIPQLVVVTGVDDDIIDGDIIYTLNLTVDDANSDDSYDGLSETVDVTNIDDDEAGITVTLSDGSNQTSETGTSDTIVIVLNSQPVTDVVIDITGLDSSEGSLDKTGLTFTDSNWDIPQLIVVTGVDDDIIDGDITYTLDLTVDDANSDDSYDGLTETVDVTNIDDDETGITVTLSNGSNQTSETGTSDTIVIVLNSQPVTDVVIDITGFDSSEGSLDKTELTFTDSNWDIPQLVVVTGVDDDIIDGDITYTLDLTVDDANSDDSYDGLTETVDVTNIDDDEAGITVTLSDGSNQTSETGTSDTIVIVLNSQPMTDVVIDITGLDISEGSLDKTGLTFTDSNWDIPQLIVVTGVDDDIIDGDITYTLDLTVDDANSDDSYDGLSETVDVTNADDDSPGFIITPTDGNNITSETGTTDEFSVVLNSKPQDKVVIDITGLDSSEGSLDKTELTFTDANWDIPQLVVVTGVDDDIIDGDITYTLDLTVDDANSDDSYDGLTETVDVTNIDDDEAGITVTLSDGSNQTSETGTSDTIVIVLNSQPVTDVVIDITGLDSSEGSLDKTELTFTDANWDIPQLVVVTGVDDDIIDGDITYTLNLTVDDANSDDSYDGLSETVDVTNADDDSPGFIITPTDGNNITSETGTTDEFSVVLNSKPQDKVVIDISGLDVTEGIISKTRLVFTDANWDIPQIVTITGKDDDIIDGDITYTLTLTVNNIGSDDNYDGMFKTTDVTNIDDENNRTPLINGETVTILQGDTATGNLLTNDSDPDGDNLIINTIPVIDASNGTVVINSDGTYSYTPNDIGFTGTDSFTYEVCDDGTPQECAAATVTITVNIKDTDGDGIPDHIEGDDDIDNDGIPNDEDEDSDGDGIPDEIEGTDDVDDDGIPNFIDPDSDDDGISDEEEGMEDCDDDGIINAYDIDPCPEEDIFIPEGFSPNNDGSNDYFVIPGLEQYNNVSIIIFNRWGNIVYKSDYYANDWDGKSNTNMSNGKDVPTGTYFYQLIINDTNQRLTGYVYLNR